MGEDKITITCKKSVEEKWFKLIHNGVLEMGEPGIATCADGTVLHM